MKEKQLERKQLVNATFEVEDDEFFNGCQTGYFAFLTDYKGEKLTDKETYDLMIGTLLNVYCTDKWNAGWILGWTRGLFEVSPNIATYSRHSSPPETSTEHPYQEVDEYVIFRLCRGEKKS